MTRVKICGITNLEDGRAAAEAGVDLLGFVFYPPSPRYTSPDSARSIIQALRECCAVQMVGVFVNEQVGRIREIINWCGLDFAQLSGDEPIEVVSQLGPRGIKALRPRDPAALSRLLTEYGRVAGGRCPAFLLDAFNPKLFGGTGESADWEQARLLSRQFPILLAGGLNPENVVDAITSVQPWGVDVSSGVERAPGIKDHEKMRQFVHRVKRRNE